MKTRLSILIVEDSPTMAEEISMLLTSRKEAKVDIEKVQTLASAVDRLKSPGIDCIVLDLILPNGSGAEVIGKVAETAPNIPIVVVTGLPAEENAGYAFQAGAQEFLEKSAMTGESLMRRIRHAVARMEAERLRAAKKFQPIKEALQAAHGATVQALALNQDKKPGDSVG